MSISKENKKLSTVELGQYKELGIKKHVHEINDSAVDAELGKILIANSTYEEVTDRPVKQGDTVTIDFEGFVDGVAFEGGKGENVDLEIGSNSFIPGFEDQIIDRNINETFDINVTFPSEYPKDDLAGKVAVFNTTLQKISTKSVAVADDAFASKIAGVPTLEDFKRLIKERLQAMSDEHSKEKMVDELLAQIIDASKFDITQEFIGEQATRMKAEYSAQLKQRGWALESYLEKNGQSIEQFDEMIGEQARTRAKSLLVVENIGKIENISVTDEDMETEYTNIAEMHQIPLEELRPRFRQEDNDIIKSIITSRKVFDLLLDSAVIS